MSIESEESTARGIEQGRIKAAAVNPHLARALVSPVVGGATGALAAGRGKRRKGALLGAMGGLALGLPVMLPASLIGGGIGGLMARYMNEGAP